MKKSFPHHGELGNFLFKCLVVAWCVLFPPILLLIIPIWILGMCQKGKSMMSKRVSMVVLLFSLFIFSTLGIAGDYNCEVYGYGDDGYVSGEVEVNPVSKEIEGYLYTDEGEEIYIEGEWVNNCQIESYDEEGNYYELEAY